MLFFSRPCETQSLEIIYKNVFSIVCFYIALLSLCGCLPKSSLQNRSIKDTEIKSSVARILSLFRLLSRPSDRRESVRDEETVAFEAFCLLNFVHGISHDDSPLLCIRFQISAATVSAFFLFSILSGQLDSSRERAKRKIFRKLLTSYQTCIEEKLAFEKKWHNGKMSLFSSAHIRSQKNQLAMHRAASKELFPWSAHAFIKICYVHFPKLASETRS